MGHLRRPILAVDPNLMFQQPSGSDEGGQWRSCFFPARNGYRATIRSPTAGPGVATPGPAAVRIAAAAHTRGPDPATLRAELLRTARALRRATVARSRIEAARARADTRDWAKARRERTRHLIELGGLVTKAGLVELTDDDRATLLGALMDVAGRLRGVGDDDPAHLRARWRRAGLRAFDGEREAAVTGQEGGNAAGERQPNGSVKRLF